MNKKILVIFLFAIIMVVIIYYFCSRDNNNILIIGEESLNIDSSKYNIQTFLYDKITYKELINCIKTNDYIIVKNRKIFLNKLISNSKYIILTVNKNDCEKNKELNDRKTRNLYNLVYLIKRMTIGEVIIINYCDNKHIEKDINIVDTKNVNKVIKGNNT